MRPTKRKYYLAIAQAVSRRSTCIRRQYGAIIVSNDRIIATGYNGSAAGEPNCCDAHDICKRKDLPHNTGYTSACPAVHAEANALISAGDRARGATLYLFGTENGRPITDARPCEMCERLIRNAGIAEVIT